MKERVLEEKFVNKDIQGKEYSRMLLIIAMLIGSFVSIFNQTILSTALPQIMKYFNITASTGQWLTTAFMLVNAIMIPLTALLLEKISTKKLFMFSMFMFGIGTIICAFSSSFEILLIGTIIAGIVVIALFVWRQLAMKNPMLEMRVFKSKDFTMTTIIGSILSIVSSGAGIMVPIFLQSILGKSAFTSGLVLLPGALIMAVMMLISGRLFDKHGVKKLAIPGIILLVIATFPFVNLHRNTSLISITVLYAIRYIGIALAIMPLQTAGMNDLPNKLLPHGSAVINTTKQVAGSLGTAVLITVMSNVSASNAPAKSLAKTNIELYKSGMLDAALKGMNTSFIVVLGIAVICLVLSLFLKGKKQNNNLIQNNKEEQVA